MLDRRAFLTGAAASLITAPALAAPRPLVLLFRGLDQVLYRGMDELGRKAEREGFAVDVMAPVLAPLQAGRRPVALVGHSTGADFALALAHSVRGSCRLLVTIEPTIFGPAAPVGMRCVNIFDPARFPVFVRVTGANNIPVRGHAHEALGRSALVHDLILTELRALR